VPRLRLKLRLVAARPPGRVPATPEFAVVETAAFPACWGVMNLSSTSPRASAALFDVDGTLVDSNDLHAAAWAEAFRCFGHDIPEQRIRFQVGKGGDNLIPALLPDLGDDEREQLEAYRSDLYKTDYLPEVEPFPGVRPLFERLRADGVAIVLASSSGRDEVDHNLDLIGCRDLVSAATSRDDVEHSKPCPDIFEAALGKAGVPADKALVVGDTPWDVKAAARTGLATIGFRSGGFEDRDLIEAGVKALYDGPEDLLRRYHSSPFARG